jgi:hypothetical protein
MKQSLLLLALVAPLSLVPAVAYAQNAAEQAEARTLFDEGVHLFQQGSYAEACGKLEASYHLFAGVGTRGKLAECYEKVGRTASAWAMYQEVAALSGKAGDERRVEVAKERAAALLPNLSHLTVVLPVSSDVPGIVVKRGAEVVERGAMGSAVAVDPGKITFTVSAPGYLEKTGEVTVAPKDQATFTVPALEPAPPTSAPPPEPAVPSHAENPPVSGEGGGTWQRPAGIAVAGAGVVTAAVGVVLALTAKSSYDGAFNDGDCVRATLLCNASGQSQTGGARSQASVGGVLIGVGAVLAAGGGVLFFLGPRTGAAASTGLELVPAMGPSAAGLTLQGGFW